jgi:hypothetical protein
MSLGEMYVGIGSGYQQVADKHKSAGFCLQHFFLSITWAGVQKKNTTFRQPDFHPSSDQNVEKK